MVSYQILNKNALCQLILQIQILPYAEFKRTYSDPALPTKNTALNLLF